MSDIDYGAFEALTFDCYGTLIDWETGIAAGLRRGLGEAAVGLPDDELLERYGRHEAELEAGLYLPYREILGEGLRRVGAELDTDVRPDDLRAFGDSVGEWPAFPDSADALRRLQRRFRLGVITYCDDDLFAASNRRLGVAFEWVVTAEQARGYKPRIANFELAFERVGLPRDRILHVAQSLYHDHVPARQLGLTSVWIDRRHDRPGTGATPPAHASTQPSARFPDLRSFAAAAAPD